MYITGRRRKASRVDNPVPAAGAARGMDGALLLELRSSSTRSGVEERGSLCPGLRLQLARDYPNQTPSGVNRKYTKSTA
ncbi:MAG: hypothetical protein LBL33_06520 [Tannerella sp.]|nr:hypothetical protein [Tannerella sp.]